jgi:hypothetical protein
MTEQAKQKHESQSKSMESSHTGIPSTQEYEYWKDKGSGDIWASKASPASGSRSFYGPLSQSEYDKSPESFSYSSNQELSSKEEQFDKITPDQFKSGMYSKPSTGMGSS